MLRALRPAAVLLACALLVAVVLDAAGPDPASAWVERTLKKLTLDEKIGQLLMPSFESSYLAADSDENDRLQGLVSRLHVGGFLVFGASEAAPPVLLNPTYGTVTLGRPLEAAATLNRLQRASKLPLLNAGDFEFGVGMRIEGATQFPRAMALGAAGDPALAEQAGRIVGEESRALGVGVDFAPVADVNNNPRNPVINTRSFGEDPERVGIMASGGLSHFLVNEELDREVIEALRRKDYATLKALPAKKLLSGSSEIRNWIAVAAAVDGLKLDWVSYVPGYRSRALTGVGLCFAHWH